MNQTQRHHEKRQLKPEMFHFAKSFVGLLSQYINFEFKQFKTSDVKGGNFKHQYQQSKAKRGEQETTKPNHKQTQRTPLTYVKFVPQFEIMLCRHCSFSKLQPHPLNLAKKKQSPNEHTDTEQQSSHGGTATLTCLSNRKSINIENKEIVMTVTGRYFKACFPVSASASTWFHLWLRTACCLAKCEKPFRWEKPLACSQMTVFGYICSRRHLLCLQFSQNTCAFDP